MLRRYWFFSKKGVRFPKKCVCFLKKRCSFHRKRTLFVILTLHLFIQLEQFHVMAITSVSGCFSIHWASCQLRPWTFVAAMYGKKSRIRMLWSRCCNPRVKAIVSSYIDFVIKFTALSYESILENQEIAAKHQKKLEYVLPEDLKKKLNMMNHIILNILP